MPNTSKSKEPAVLYKHLSQTHAEYCGETMRDYWSLYKGGRELFKDPAHLARMIPREMGEHDARYRERLRSATYINHFGKIVGFFVSAIFQQQVQVLVDGSSESTDDYYERFQKNADGQGNHLTFCLRKALVSAMVHKRGLLIVDFPKGDTGARSELDQRRMGGARLPYLVHRNTEELINWRKNPDGTFMWCVFRRLLTRQAGPLTEPETVEEFKVWNMLNGQAVCSTFETKPIKEGSPEAAMLESGTKGIGAISPELIHKDTLGTPFKRIPVILLEIEEDLWVGDRVAPLAREHFQRRTALRTAIGKHLFSIPFVKLGADIPEVGGAVNTNQNDGSNLRSELMRKGFICLGENDDVGFAEPTGQAYELEARLEQELVDEMYRVGEQMSNSIAMTSSGVYRSGISKAEDRYGTELVLETYSARARAFAKQIVETICEARNEGGQSWEARGAEDFTLWDRNTTLAEAVNVDKVSLPSKTFHVKYKTQVASRMLKDPTPEEVASIKKEIEADIDENGVPDPRAERIEQQELAMKQAEKQAAGGQGREKGPVTSGQISGDANKVSTAKASTEKV